MRPGRLPVVDGYCTSTVPSIRENRCNGPHADHERLEVAASTHEHLTCPQESWADQDPAERQHCGAERGFLAQTAPTRRPRRTRRWQWRIRRKSREHRSLAIAFLFSLVIHALLLSLRFGGEELGLPGLAFPWRDRRIEVPDLRVVLVAPPVAPAKPAIIAAAKASQRVSADTPRAETPVLERPMAAAPDGQGAAPTNAHATKPPVQVDAPRSRVAPAASMEAPIRAQEPERLLPAQIAEAPALEVKAADGPWSVVRAERSRSGAVNSAAPSASSADSVDSASQDRADVAQEEQRNDAVRREAARAEAARLEAERQEVVRQAAVQLQARRQEAALQEAARVEAARLESEREENARQAAAQLESQRQVAAHQEAARLEVARLEAERQENARQAAAQMEAQRQVAARQEAARLEVARLEAERQENARQAAAQLESQRQVAARQEAARLEVARLEAERQENARQAAVQREQRQQTLRQEAARVEAARLEAERQENARLAQLEAQRQESARQQAARVEVARLEVERQETARQAAVPLEAQPQVAARQQPARVEPVPPQVVRLATAPQAVPREGEQDDGTRREAALRAIGRQLDEEAARRQAASTASNQPSTLPYSLSTARRVRLWGRTDPNVELVQYAEAWARKIQLNTAVEKIREVVKRPHTPSMVTVAVRSDGSVESVIFVVSSGVAEIDEAIRRIVESQKPYSAFPRALSRDFDVIEIRRTWYFDSGVRLQ